MKQKNILALPLLALSLTACHKSIPEQTFAPENVSPSIVRISETERAPIMLETIGSLQTMSVGNHEDIASVFGDAQAVVPVPLWSPREAQDDIHAQGLPATDGFTITFYDFNGVSFAYANQVAKNNPKMSVNGMVRSHSRNKSFSDDFTDWTEATYVTGANTRRTTISDVLPGFPIL